MAFSENLCKLMDSGAVSSYKLAKAIDVHVSTVTNWREGASPKVEHLKKIADFFGVSMDALV